LKKEIEYNYKIFTNFIKVINEHDISNKKPNNIHLILLNNLITFPFPIYSKDAYVNQFSTLTAYYSEKEIDYIINFLCEKMDRITSIKNTATYLKEIETDANNIVTGETGMFKGTDMLHINRTFIEKAPNFWSDRKLEFKQLIELSNNILTEMN
jgi:hypothetical protein